jgi:hypothetical protein
VGKLPPWHRSLRLDESKNAGQHLDLRIFSQAEIFRTDPSLLQHRGRLGKNKCGRRHGQPNER